MAGASLLTLLDDIAAILDDVALMTKVAARKSVAMADDVAVMSKVAAQKTAGVLGDDLALNAEQVSGVRAERELPVVWSVCKGSLINKVILVPAALAISAWLPWAVTPLLMLGGAFLCYEGFEKLVHKYLHRNDAPGAHGAAAAAALAGEEIDLVAMEKDKIRGAIRTDFILSAEIITIALGTVAAAPFVQQLAVLSGIALVMTLGVYGLVAGIVKLDDVGLWLMRKSSSAAQAMGRGLVSFTPWLMKGLSVAGTAAMFLVGGGILAHGVPLLHHISEGAGAAAAQWPGGPVWAVLAPNGVNAVVGIVAGALVLAGVTLVQRVRGGGNAAAAKAH